MATLAPTGMSRRYRIFRRVMLLVGRLLFGFEIHGAEKVPEKGPLIVAANHWRFFDPVFVCMAVPRRIQWMAKKELFLPPLDKFFGFLGAFPVDRSGSSRAAVRTALMRLAEGWAMGIFPEGTRQRGGSAGEAKTGMVVLAVRSGAPVVPVFVDRVPSLPARLRGERIHAYIGDPIVVPDTLRGRDEYRAAADGALRTIYSLPKR